MTSHVSWQAGHGMGQSRMPVGNSTAVNPPGNMLVDGSSQQPQQASVSAVNLNSLCVVVCFAAAETPVSSASYGTCRRKDSTIQILSLECRCTSISA